MYNRILISIVINLFLIISLFAQNEKISHSLQNALRLTPENETQKVWIYFTDKGGDLGSKLRSVELNLSERSKIRRSKSMGKNIVDRFDIPINSNYLHEVALYTEKIDVKSRWLNAISAKVRPHNIDLLASKNFIKKLDVVRKFKRIEPEDSVQPIESTGIENVYTFDYGSSHTQNAQIHVPELHDMGINGSGVLVCMLDAGFNNLQHEALIHLNILHTWDFVNGDSIVWDEPGQMGTGNHGTNTLSTIAGFYQGELIGPAYGADFILGKTENTEWERHIEEDHWVAGAEWADSLGADLISSSLGYRDGFTHGEPDYTWQDMDGNTAIATIGADIAVSRGIVVVNSAGNSGNDTYNTLGAPADGDSVIAVAAVNSSGTRVSFSSVGPTADGRIKPDVAAMGSGVVVASASNPTGYNTSSGTSFSCPLTAGVAALVLSANPSLTPMQVRDALRETASQAGTPDKYLGWGIVHAYNAVFYYKAIITHSQINDTEDLNGPYEITAKIESTFPLIPSEIKLTYGIDTNFGNEIIMQPTGNPNEYSAHITGTGSVEEYFYYIQAKNDQQTVTYLPFNAPIDYFRFYAGPDTISPVISHNSLNNQPLSRWPAKIKAQVSDNLGIDSVWVEYKINSGGIESFIINNITTNTYEGYFPVVSGSLSAGDVIDYRINAIDNSTAANVTILPGAGYYSFEMIDVSGFAIVIDDDQNTKIEKSGKMNYVRSLEKIGSAATRFESVLSSMGYLVDNISSSLIDTSALSQYDLIISSSGGDLSPISSVGFRNKLENWVLSNPDHKLVIEGGEVGYDALSSPGYPSFSSNVLHSYNWLTDDAGNLVLKPDQITHPVASIPNQLPSNIALNSTEWWDKDAVEETADAYSVFGWTSRSTAGSVIVYDDDLDTTNAQIIYMTFNIDAINDTTIANHLIENSVTYLMHREVTSVDPNREDNNPQHFTLMQNYPNPFNPQTTIKYAIPNSGNVELIIYNLKGQQVYRINQGFLKAGWHKFVFNGSGFSTGIYFYKMKIKDESGKLFSKTRKMVYIK